MFLLFFILYWHPAVPTLIYFHLYCTFMQFYMCSALFPILMSFCTISTYVPHLLIPMFFFLYTAQQTALFTPPSHWFDLPHLRVNIFPAFGYISRVLIVHLQYPPVADQRTCLTYSCRNISRTSTSPSQPTPPTQRKTRQNRSLHFFTLLWEKQVVKI